MFWLQPISDLDAWAKMVFTEFTVFNKWMLLHKNQVCLFGIIGQCECSKQFWTFVV